MNADIIMTTYDSSTRKMIVVHPEDEIEVTDTTPWFWSAVASKYITVPGYEATDVYSEWITNA